MKKKAIKKIGAQKGTIDHVNKKVFCTEHGWIKPLVAYSNKSNPPTPYLYCNQNNPAHEYSKHYLTALPENLDEQLGPISDEPETTTTSTVPGNNAVISEVAQMALDIRGEMRILMEKIDELIKEKNIYFKSLKSEKRQLDDSDEQ